MMLGHEQEAEAPGVDLLIERDVLQVAREELQTRLLVLEEDPAVGLQIVVLLTRLDTLQRVIQESQNQWVDREDK
jgi:hypothetical protein